MQTEFDDMKYMVVTPSDEWYKVNKSVLVDGETVFHLDRKDSPALHRTYYTLDDMSEIVERSEFLFMDEKEFLAWYLKHGN
jgi:hypothetical protein